MINWGERLLTPGYWGPVTSSLDWCETNYEYCYYIAELFNTLTNVTYILLSAYGIHQCVKYGYEKRFILGFLALLLVGAGSWLFHSTLRYEMQMCDEIPMIYLTCVLLYNIFELVPTKTGAPRFPVLIPVLILYALGFTVFYIFIVSHPLVHQVMYVAAVGALLGRSYWALHNQLGVPPHTDVAEKATAVRVLVIAFGCYAAGTFAWLVDNFFCLELRDLRAFVGEPWAALFQFHGWWHVLSGLGAIWYMTFNMYLRELMLIRTRSKGRTPTSAVRVTGLFGLPQAIRFDSRGENAPRAEIRPLPVPVRRTPARRSKVK